MRATRVEITTAASACGIDTSAWADSDFDLAARFMADDFSAWSLSIEDAKRAHELGLMK